MAERINVRYSLLLQPSLKAKAQEYAKAREESLGDVIRRVLAKEVGWPEKEERV